MSKFHIKITLVGYENWQTSFYLYRSRIEKTLFTVFLEIPSREFVIENIKENGIVNNEGEIILTEILKSKYKRLVFNEKFKIEKAVIKKKNTNREKYLKSK